jgi:hypothetical protein
MTFTSAAKFLILDPTFPLRAVLPHFRSALRRLLRRPIAQCRLAYGEGSVFDQQPGWEECDSYSAGRIQRG